MRAYSTAVVADALGVTRGWLDGVIAMDRLAGVRPDRQGKSRAIPPRVVLTIAIAIQLNEWLGTPIAMALDLAEALIESGEHRPAPGLAISLDVAAIERRIARRLTEALEENPPAPRGRPARDRSGRAAAGASGGTG